MIKSKNMEIEQLLQALIDGDISPKEFKRQAEGIELPPSWMIEEGARPRPGPNMPSENLPWENLPAWMDECKG